MEVHDPGVQEGSRESKPRTKHLVTPFRAHVAEEELENDIEIESPNKAGRKKRFDSIELRR